MTRHKRYSDHQEPSQSTIDRYRADYKNLHKKAKFENDRPYGGSNNKIGNLGYKPKTNHGMFKQVAGYDNVYILSGNSHKLLISTLRDANTQRKDYVAASDRLSTILLEGSLGHEKMVTEKRLSPTGSEYDHHMLANPKLCYVSILRSAEAMLTRTFQLADDVASGFVLIQRNEATAKPEYFYHKFPKDLNQRTVFVVDPMLATGGSIIKCIDLLIKEGVVPENIRFVNIISAPEGIRNLSKAYPEVKFYTAAIDEK